MHYCSKNTVFLIIIQFCNWFQTKNILNKKVLWIFNQFFQRTCWRKNQLLLRHRLDDENNWPWPMFSVCFWLFLRFFTFSTKKFARFSTILFWSSIFVVFAYCSVISANLLVIGRNCANWFWFLSVSLSITFWKSLKLLMNAFYSHRISTSNSWESWFGVMFPSFKICLEIILNNDAKSVLLKPFNNSFGSKLIRLSTPCYWLSGSIIFNYHPLTLLPLQVHWCFQQFCFQYLWILFRQTHEWCKQVNQDSHQM